MRERADGAAKHRPTDAEVAAYEATNPEFKARTQVRAGVRDRALLANADLDSGHSPTPHPRRCSRPEG